MRKEIIQYINEMIGVDVSKVRTEFTKQWERDGEIIIEWRELPRTEWQYLEQLVYGKNSKLRMESAGVWGKMITFAN